VAFKPSQWVHFHLTFTKELKQALQVDCNHVGAHYNLGLNYARLNQPDMAIFELKEALRINPNFAIAQQTLVLTCEQLTG